MLFTFVLLLILLFTAFIVIVWWAPVALGLILSPVASILTSTFIGILAAISPTFPCPGWFLFPNALKTIFPKLFIGLLLLFWLLFPAFIKFSKFKSPAFKFNSPTFIGIEVDCKPISWQTTPMYPIFGAVLKLELFITLLKSWDALLVWAKAL